MFRLTSEQSGESCRGALIFLRLWSKIRMETQLSGRAQRAATRHAPMMSVHATQHNSQRLHHILIIPMPRFFCKGGMGKWVIVLHSDLSGGVELYAQHRFFVFPADAYGRGLSPPAGPPVGNHGRPIVVLLIPGMRARKRRKYTGLQHSHNNK